MKKQLLLISSLSVLAAVAYAGQQQQSQFQGLDSNTDGYISQQEASGNEALSKQWGALDTNNDNQLDQSEFSAFEIQHPMKKDSEMPEKMPMSE